MSIDLERVKRLTLDKVDIYDRKPSLTLRKVLPVAAVLAIALILLVGAAVKFDWNVMVNGKMQQGNYGDTIVVGDGFAAMSPTENQGNNPATEVVFPDDKPNRTAELGELSLFFYKSEDGSVIGGRTGIRTDDSTSLANCKQLAADAEVPIAFPSIISDDYKLISSCTQFYAKESQLKDTKLLYSYWGEHKNQQLFALPKGYSKYIDSMHLELETPTGDFVTFSSLLTTSDSQVYGGGANPNIEQLGIDGYDSVIFVADDGWNQLYAWKKIKKVETIDTLTFGEDERPEDNLFHERRDNAVYRWQQYSFTSYTLPKDELVKLLESIAVAK